MQQPKIDIPVFIVASTMAILLVYYGVPLIQIILFFLVFFGILLTAKPTGGGFD